MKNKVLVFVSIFIMSSIFTFAQGLSDFEQLAPKYSGDLPTYKLSQTGLKGKIRSIVVKTGEGEEKFGEVSFKDYDDAELTVFSFDEKGNLLNCSYFGKIGGDRMLQSKVVYSYDNKNRLLRMDNYNSLGQRMQSSLFNYNQNNVISSIKSDMLDNGYNEYEIDKNGVIIKTRIYDNNGNLTDVYNYDNRYTYFSSGKLQTVVSYSNDQPIESKTLDNFGRVVEEVHFKEGIWSKKYLYSYNTKGFLSTFEKTRIVSGSQGVWSYSSVYDNHGNVIKTYVGDSSTGIYLTTFEIDYW